MWHVDEPTLRSDRSQNLWLVAADSWTKSSLRFDAEHAGVDEPKLTLGRAIASASAHPIAATKPYRSERRLIVQLGTRLTLTRRGGVGQAKPANRLGRVKRRAGRICSVPG